MRIIKAVQIILLLTISTVLSGCLAAAVGAGAVGTVAYIKGDIEAVENKGIDDVYTATKKTMKKLGLSVTQDQKDAISAEIIARDAEDKKITIKLSSTGYGSTKLSIRVGLFGDETKSTRIYQEIHDNLKGSWVK
jgi:hypothetical protein